MTTRTSPVSEIMRVDFVALHPDDTVETAMRTLVERDVDTAAVTDGDGVLVGTLSNTDLIVQETQLHFPTLLYFLGASFEIGKKRFNDELTTALASEVGQVMTTDVITCRESDTIEGAATLMHDNDLAIIPVVRDDRVVGLVSRNDILRAILASP